VIFVALCAVLVAATPDPVSVGSVDGPFAWGDVRASVDGTSLLSSGDSTASPLIGQVVSGSSVLVQEQLFAGWGLGIFERRLVVGLSFSATEVITDPTAQSDLARLFPRFDWSPLQVVTAMPLSIDGLTVVPILTVTLPTRNAFGTDPIVGIQPQLRMRAAVGRLLVGGSAFVDVPAVNTWEAAPYGGNYATRRCPREATRCRLPVARELWAAGVSLQFEYWFRSDLSAGALLAFEGRHENRGRLVGSFVSADGAIGSPGWSVLATRGRAFLSWAPFDHFGLTTTAGAAHQGFIGVAMTGTSWEASLSVWFRTDARLDRFWLDR
jgi:hypothetical protein